MINVTTIAKQPKGVSTEASPGAVAKRFGINLRQLDVERLYDIAQAHDITPTEVIRRALATESKLLKIVHEGGHVLAEKADGRMLELDLNY